MPAFPEQYRNDAFVALRDSLNRIPPNGYKIAFIELNKQGRPVQFVDFVTGFSIDNREAPLARVAGAAAAPDWSLLFSNESRGIIYKISLFG